MKKNKTVKSDKKRFFIPLGAELITISSLILIISLSTMIILATDFFKKESRVRIEENNHAISQIISQKVKSDFQSIVKFAAGASKQIKELIKNEGLTKQLFANDKDIIYIGIAGPDKNGLSPQAAVYNTAFLEINGISKQEIRNAIIADGNAFTKSFSMLEVVYNISPRFKIPIIAISVPHTKKSETSADSILIALVSMNRFLDSVRISGITMPYIVNGDGDLIAHNDASLVKAKINYKNIPIVKLMMTSPVNNSLTRFNDDKGEFHLGAFYKVGFANTCVIVTVLESKAFAEVYRIQYRNILITLIVLASSIFIVYFFSKTLIRPIIHLVKATHDVEEGRFEMTFSRYPRNELGTLMKSFQQMGQGLAEREKIKVAFGKFVNKEIAERVLRGEIALGGERKHVTVFFSDIRSFTAISEKLEPEEVVEFLNQYMSRMVQCVNETHGVVDKFIGDAVMAVWGAPVSYGNDTENAINGALRMRSSLIEFNENRGGDKKPIIRIGCGINTGPVLAGQIGSQDKMEYTVIGDTVNLASRIEALNKPFGTDILISEDAYKMVMDIFIVEKMQPITVKGKEKPLQIYAVLGRRDDPTTPKDLVSLRSMLGIEIKETAAVDSNFKEEKYEILSADEGKKSRKKGKK